MLIWRANRLGRFDVAANAWHDLGSPPSHTDNCMSTAGPDAQGALLGKVFYVWSGGCKPQFGSAFDLDAGAWSTLPDAPGSTSGADPTQDPYWDRLFSITAAGNRLLALQGKSTASIVAFDTGARRWTKLAPAANPPGTTPFVAWTGTELLVWGGFDDGTTVRGGSAYQPSS
jgi:hypothetical protein